MSFRADFRLVFLDDPSLARAIDKAERKNLTAQGALVRSIARRSMRRRKGPSAPGSPPSVHSGELKNLLVFSWDRLTESVVVGPAWFSGSPVPAALEHGGTTVRTVRRRGGVKQKVPVRIAARPFIAPAVDKAQEKFHDIWKNSIVP